MTDESKQKLKEFMDASVVISDYLSQQVQNGTISQLLYVKNIKRFVEALDEMMEIKNEWK